jgi:hypothetical protein
MYFNRFAVEREEHFVQVHFGLVNKMNALADHYSTVISQLELLHLKKTLMDYLGAQGTLLEGPPPWQPPVATRTEIADHMIMARHGPIAETGLYSFSFWAALMEAKNSKDAGTLAAEPIALLRSPLAVQQHLIKLLFSQSEALFPGE